MCGRYGLKLSLEPLLDAASALGAGSDRSGLARWSPREAIAPSEAAPILLGDTRNPPRLRLARWGLSHPARVGRLVINARTETLSERPLFARGRPALIPASGWYEWRERGHRQPRDRFWLSREGTELLWLAGLGFEPSQPGAPVAFVILTRPPTPPIADIHDRMPALPDGDLAPAWLAGTLPPSALLADDPGGLCAHLDGQPAPAQLDLF